MQNQLMIVKSSNAEVLHVLGTQVRFLCEGTNTKSAWSLMEVTLPLNSGPPPHTHDWDEAYYVLSGEVQFTVGGEQALAATGDFIYTPGGVPHGLRGASNQPARLLIFDAPAHAGAFFKRIDREVKNLPDDLGKILEIGEATGIRFLPHGLRPDILTSKTAVPPPIES
jgi:quercetin dioxygenase-like cupin family protein